MSRCVVGVDVGGTNIKFGIVSSSGKVISRSSLSTKSFIHSKKGLIEAVSKSVLVLMEQCGIKKKDVTGVGVGFPGLIDAKKGVVQFLPNIPGWRNIPARKIFQDRLRLPIFIDNDVKLITLAEWRYGAGREFKNIICITLGTGVGGGLVIDNKLYRGEGFVAGELGHLPLNENGPHCNCGSFACLESYVGNKRLVKRASEIIKNKNVTLEEMFRLANQRNAQAMRFWTEVATHIGNGLVGVVNLLNPRRIIIGGGVANNWKYLAPTIRSIIKTRAMSTQARMVEIVRAQLGDDAGIIGAKVLVQDEI